jgi:hypothetical protein
MKFEKSFFEPKQKLTAAALNRIENSLATVTDTVYKDDEIILSELLPDTFKNTTITSEDMTAQLTDADGIAYELIQAGIAISMNTNSDDMQTAFDAMIGCKYDGVKYYCKPIVVLTDAAHDYIMLYIGNLKVMHDFMVLLGNIEDAELIQNAVSKAGCTLDVFENLPFVLAVISGEIHLVNVENGNITESFGSHTFEIISSIPLESKGILQESMVIDKLPDISEEVFVRGFNAKTSIKLHLLYNKVPVLINGILFNMDYKDTFSGQLPDGSEPSFVYSATAVDCYDNILRVETHYFTDTDNNSTGFTVDGKLIYRGSRTIRYDLSSLKLEQ